ncbi:hypothetical protein PsYK624_140790 [Phanerochaete sordida]|uniref:Uncharacterized protein n=1 Tax=Phanerochaete sordida TaxID=48140 RepID=A0A9P3LL26_9APHY|nr:hypothetical protein PsYK624_140790 [Phanerochaete sordida]
MRKHCWLRVQSPDGPSGSGRGLIAANYSEQALLQASTATPLSSEATMEASTPAPPPTSFAKARTSAACEHGRTQARRIARWRIASPGAVRLAALHRPAEPNRRSVVALPLLRPLCRPRSSFAPRPRGRPAGSSAGKLIAAAVAPEDAPAGVATCAAGASWRRPFAGPPRAPSRGLYIARGTPANGATLRRAPKIRRPNTPQRRA